MLGEPRDRARAGRPARAADRRRHAAAARARDLRRCRRSPACRTCSSATPRRARRSASRRRAGPVAAAGRPHSAEPGGAARLAALPRLPRRRSSEHFDWVVIDTPPVMVVTDSCIVGNEATGVVFVVGADKTSRHAARERASSSSKAANAQLDRLGAEPRRPQAALRTTTRRTTARNTRSTTQRPDNATIHNSQLTSHIATAGPSGYR